MIGCKLVKRKSHVRLRIIKVINIKFQINYPKKTIMKKYWDLKKYRGDLKKLIPKIFGEVYSLVCLIIICVHDLKYP